MHVDSLTNIIIERFVVGSEKNKNKNLIIINMFSVHNI